MDTPDGSNSVQSFVGIVVAIVGNIVISLALNCQKLAHKRLEIESKTPPHLASQKPTLDSRPSFENNRRRSSGAGTRRHARETTPLKPLRSGLARYSSIVSSRFELARNGSSRTHYAIPATDSDDDISSYGETIPSSRVLGVVDTTSINGALSLNAPHDDIAEEDAEADEEEEGDPFLPDTSPSSEEDEVPEKSEASYLKSKLWWLGFGLMNLGEIGNFMSYGFAPASLVAPLGSFALIANCFLAPVMLGEKFRKMDLLGLSLCIVGIVTIVVGGKASDTRLDPDALIHAITRTVFVVYTIICVVLASILAVLSNKPIGQRTVWIDIGLCALFGGYTVLCTKGISTLLGLAWIQIFTFWITYPLALVLLLTGIAQIRYLNRALMKFPSKVVIPTQFVLFNFAAILGSAVLYRDFDRVPYERMIIFLYGCATTFGGVFVLARPSDDGEGSDVEGEGTLRGDDDDASETGTNVGNGVGIGNRSRPVSPLVHRRSSLTFQPSSSAAGVPFPATSSPTTQPQTQAALMGSLRGAGPNSLLLRQRASSSIGLSPGKYLLLATESSNLGLALGASSSSPPANAPGVVALPIAAPGGGGRPSQRAQSHGQASSLQTPPARVGLGLGFVSEHDTSRSRSRGRQESRSTSRGRASRGD